MLRPNVSILKPRKLSGWRKIAIGTWQDVGDPSVYGILEFEVDTALQYLERKKQESGTRLTITHFVGRAVAEAIKQNPSINSALRMGRLYPRQSVDIFFQVASDNTGQDLSGMVIRDAGNKSVVEIAKEMEAKVSRIRKEGDPDYKKMKGSMRLLPGFLSHFFVNLTGHIMYGLNLWSPLLGVPRDPFGSAMVTNVGSLGLETAFVPLVPYSRCPLLLAVAAIKEKPVVRDGKIEIAKTLQICATFDHRLIDGVHASHMVRCLKQVFENPALVL